MIDLYSLKGKDLVAIINFLSGALVASHCKSQYGDDSNAFHELCDDYIKLAYDSVCS